jgi:hypothetical protein
MSRLGSRFLFASGVLGMALVAGQGFTARGAGLQSAVAKEEGPVAGALRGVWTAERSKWRVENGATATLVELSLRRVGGRGQWNSSETLPLAELRGLTAAMWRPRPPTHASPGCATRGASTARAASRPA